FAISGSNNTCGSTVHANQNCSFQVTFTPTVGVGSRTGTVNLSFGGGLASQMVALSGAAGTPAFQANPATLNFGNVVAGQASRRFDLIIANTGTGPMHFPTPVIQGGQAGDFQACELATGHCGGPYPWPSFIDAGKSIDVTMFFSPSGIGARSAQ